MAVGDPYLDQAEYQTYGIPGSTDPAVVWQACVLVDLFTKRMTSGTEGTDGVVNGLWSGSYTQLFRCRPDRNTVRLPYAPATVIEAISGRYVGTRRGDYHQHLTLEQRLSTGGLGRTEFVTIDKDLCVILPNNRLEFPVNPYTGLGYTELQVTYTAGYTVIPAPVKRAVAMIVKEMPQSFDERSIAMFRDIQESKHRVTRFEPGFVPPEARQLLHNYVVRSYGTNG